MQELTDVWQLESTDQEVASEDLNIIIAKAMKFSGISERAYLRKLWDNERWQSIKKKLQVEGSVWYVWWMDGVNAHLNNLKKAGQLDA